MASPVVAGIGTSNETVATTTHDVVLPASIAAGDLLVHFFDFDSNGGAPSSHPAGWNVLWSIYQTGNRCGLLAAWKIATGSETNFTLTTGANAGSHSEVWRITGHAVSASRPPIYRSINHTGGAGDPPPVYGYEFLRPQDVLSIVNMSFENTGPSSYPSGYTDNQNGGTYVSARGWRRCSRSFSLTDPGVEDPPAFSGGSGSRSLITLMVPSDAGDPDLSAPLLRNAVGRSSAALGTSHSVTLPDFRASDDVLMLALSLSTNGTISGLPSGWTVSVNTTGSGAGGERLYIALKRVDGSETDFTLASSNSATSATRVFAVQGVGLSTTPAAAATADPGSASANPNPPSVSASASGTNLWVAAAECELRAVTGYPANYTYMQEATTSQHSLGIAARQLDAASEDPGTFTFNGSSRWVAATLAFAPEEAPPQEYDRTATDSTSVSETADFVVGRHGDAVDTTDFSESAAASGTYTRAIDDTTTVVDAISHVSSGGQAYSRAVVDTAATTESLGRQLAAVRAPSDTTSLTEAPVGTRSVAAALSEGLATTDTLAQIAGRFRALTESLTTTDTLARAQVLARAPTEIIPTTAVPMHLAVEVVTPDPDVPSGHLPGGSPPSLVSIRIEGVEYADDVDFRHSNFTTYANGNPGACEVWIRVLDGAEPAIETGSELIVRFRGIKMWGGFVMAVKRSYVFDSGSGRGSSEHRYVVLEGADYNILMRKRIYFDPTDPTKMHVRRWPAGTWDSVAISQIVNNYLDLSGDRLSFDIQHVGTPMLPTVSCNPDAPDRFAAGSAGHTWEEVMAAIASQIGSIYYIDPDRTFRYVDDATRQSAFGYEGVSDAPSGGLSDFLDEFGRTASGSIGDTTHYGEWSPTPSVSVSGGRLRAGPDGDGGWDLLGDLNAREGELSLDFWSGVLDGTYAVGWRQDGRHTNVYVDVNGGHAYGSYWGNTFDTGIDLVVDDATWYTFKAELDRGSDEIRMKMWERGTAEPGWMSTHPLDPVAADFSAFLYLGSYHVTGEARLDNFSVEDGAVASADTLLGYRDFEITRDGTKLVNEQWTWGAGQGSPNMVLGHHRDDGSVAEHGLWQGAELRYDMYCQDSVDLRAQTWIEGSPQNRRGHGQDKIFTRFTVFEPYFRVGDVIRVENTTFGFNRSLGVRGAEITFPTPWDIQMVLTAGHEIDAPWSAYEFWFPHFGGNFRFPDFGFPPIDFPPFPPLPPLPDDPCAGEVQPVSWSTPVEVLAKGRLQYATTDQAVNIDLGFVAPTGDGFSFHIQNWGTSTMELHFWSDADTGTSPGFWSVPAQFEDNEPLLHANFPSGGWAWFRVLFTDDYCYVRAWLDGAPEPGNWQYWVERAPLGRSVPSLGTPVRMRWGAHMNADFGSLYGWSWEEIRVKVNDQWYMADDFEDEGPALVGSHTPGGDEWVIENDQGTYIVTDGYAKWYSDGIFAGDAYVDIASMLTSSGDSITTDACLSYSYSPPNGPSTGLTVVADGEAEGYISDLGEQIFTGTGNGGYGDLIDIDMSSCEPLGLTFATAGDESSEFPIVGNDFYHQLQIRARSSNNSLTQLCNFTRNGANWNMFEPVGGNHNAAFPGNAPVQLNFSVAPDNVTVSLSAGAFSWQVVLPAAFTGLRINSNIFYQHGSGGQTIPDINTYAWFSTASTIPADPCAGAPGELADPITEPGAVVGEDLRRGSTNPSGETTYHLDHQYQPGSTEIWVNGSRIRLGFDYTESAPHNKQILILDHIDIGTEEAPASVSGTYTIWTFSGQVPEEEP